MHLGQDDLPQAVARRLLGPGPADRRLGRQPGRARAGAPRRRRLPRGRAVQPDRVPKADAGAAIGAAGLARVRALTDLPIVAIGGIAATAAEAVAPGRAGSRYLGGRGGGRPGGGGATAPPGGRRGPARDGRAAVGCAGMVTRRARRVRADRATGGAAARPATGSSSGSATTRPRSRPPGHLLLVTTDGQVEGVHFLRDGTPARSLGHRALARTSATSRRWAAGRAGRSSR